MKTKRVAAVALSVALVTTCAVSLAGCTDKKGKFNISDYAYKSETSEARSGYTSVSYISDAQSVNSRNGYLIFTDYAGAGADTHPVYSVYSAEYNKSIVSNLNNYPEFVNIRLNNVYGVQTYENDSYTLYAPDGTVLSANSPLRITVALFNAFIDGESSSGISVSGGNEEVNYFKTDYENGLWKYTSVQRDKLKYYGPESEVGAVRNDFKEPIYSNLESYPISGELLDYSVAEIGREYIFYKNDEKIGSVDMTYAQPLGSVGTNFYYQEMLPVDNNSSDYNALNFDSDGNVVKYKVTLNCYDFSANRTSKVDYDGYVYRMYSLYNYTEGTYDAAVVEGWKAASNGKIYIDGNITAYIVDKNFNVAYDVSAFNIQESEDILDIGGGNYAVDSRGNNGYIIDGDFNVINTIRSSEGLLDGIIPFSSNNYYGFTDLSGTVVIEPKYVSASGNGAPTFYGGYAIAGELQPDGSIKAVILSSNGSVVKTFTEEEQENIRPYNGYYIVSTPNEESDTYTYSLYNLAGQLIESFNNVLSFSVLNEASGIIQLRIVDSESGNTKYSVYKLS